MSGHQYQFDASAHNPSYGGASALPPGKYKVVIDSSQATENKDKTGGFLEFTLKVIDGPLTGATHVDRLNVWNQSQQAVKIAQERLAAYCYCVGKGGFNNTAELHNIPFTVEIGPQKDNQNYTEVKKLSDVSDAIPVKRSPEQQQANAAPNFNNGQPQQPANNGGFQGGAPQQPPQGGFQPPTGGFQPQPPQQPQQPAQGGFQGGGGAAPWKS